MEAGIKDLYKELWLRKRNNKEIVWKTKDGKGIPLCEMTDQHLENAIRYLERKEDFLEYAYDHEDAGDRI